VESFNLYGNDNFSGVIPNAAEHIFHHICQRPKNEFIVRVSYFEVYNEDINDLLTDPLSTEPSFRNFHQTYEIKDLIEEIVTDVEDVLSLIQRGRENIRKNNSNVGIRRNSHVIFMFMVDQYEDGVLLKSSKLKICDLIGGQRRTGVSGKRIKKCVRVSMILLSSFLLLIPYFRRRVKRMCSYFKVFVRTW